MVITGIFVVDEVGALDVSVAFIEGDLEGFNTTLLDLVDGFTIFFVVAGNCDLVLAEVAFCVVLVPWVVAVVVVGAGCHGASFPVHVVPLVEIFIPSGHRHVRLLG